MIDWAGGEVELPQLIQATSRGFILFMSRRQSSRRHSRNHRDASLDEPNATSTTFELLPAELQLVNSLTAQQRLLVVQAVHELGNEDWEGVSELLLGHSLLKHARPGGLHIQQAFTSENTRQTFNALMKQAGLDPDPPQEPALAPALLKVAEKYYMERVYELHDLMKKESANFQACFNEIDQIKTGKQDYLVLGQDANGDARPPVRPTKSEDGRHGMGLNVDEASQPNTTATLSTFPGKVTGET
ncbi:hypothetical protein OIO90_004553 [Microbotryomycetes sp. JL221]|nr:hypothetical protein OIO90_004553 [Microbotryomycetes sp. JL221]